MRKMTSKNWSTIYPAVTNIQSAGGNLRADPFVTILQKQCDGLNEKIKITERNIKLLRAKIQEENIVLKNINLTLPEKKKRMKWFFWSVDTNDDSIEKKEIKRQIKMIKKRIGIMKGIKLILENRIKKEKKQLDAIQEDIWKFKIHIAKPLYWTFIYKNVIEYPFLETIEEIIQCVHNNMY
ncbi:uncharacterized protein LOC143809955 isoform X2 [Ranitomeya variabilis]|uniref:uncharacterized protein LOC143809955 isoform X2 n=1 Tax=Ranitomeya variabilis TaxID=490064 RepID=UPI004057043D